MVYLPELPNSSRKSGHFLDAIAIKYYPDQYRFYFLCANVIIFSFEWYCTLNIRFALFTLS